jgi:hypothetical protein
MTDPGMMTVRADDYGLRLSIDGELALDGPDATVALTLDRYELGSLRDALDYMLKREDWLTEQPREPAA